MKKTCFMFFYESLKTCFLCFLPCFFGIFNVVFLLFFESITYKIKNFKYDAFLKGKDFISWTERVFCSSIIDFI